MLSIISFVPVSASSNMSPLSRRRHIRQSNNTPSSGSSRNESPRFMKSEQSENQYGVLKLKKSARQHPNRNSASYQPSTLQEDLMKLIGQDLDSTKPKVQYGPQIWNALNVWVALKVFQIFAPTCTSSGLVVFVGYLVCLFVIWVLSVFCLLFLIVYNSRVFVCLLV